jgi:hypothetical protein
MKNKVLLIILTVAMSISISGCGKSNTSSVIENLNNLDAMQYTEFNTSISLKEEDLDLNLEFKGVGIQNGLCSDIKYSVDGSELEDLTRLSVSREGFYVETRDGELEDFLTLFTDADLDIPENTTLYFDPYNDYVDIQNINYKSLRKYINQGLIQELEKQDKKFVNKDKDIFYFSINGTPLKSSLLTILNYTKSNAENIFMDYYNRVDEEAKEKMNSSKEYTIKQIESLCDKMLEYVGKSDFSNTVLTYKNIFKDGVYQELISIENLNGKTIKINNNLKEVGGLEIMLPKEILSVTETGLINDVEDNQKNAEQLENFYQNKYPESGRIKNIIKTLGYNNPQLSTTINDVNIYATRESRSLDMKYEILDEIAVVVENDWLSTITLTNSFSLSDYRLYKNSLIENTIKEISTIIEHDFLIEINEEFGSFENVIEDWEFFAEIINAQIDENDGIVTVKLTAKQH